MSKPRRLTLKQQLFIDNYITNGGNGVKAAESAGYNGSYNVLANIALQNLNKVDINTVLVKKTAEISIKNKVNADTLLIETDNILVKCLEKGNFAAAAKCIELKAKLTGSFTKDRPNPDANKPKQLSAKEQEILSYLGEQYVLRKYQPATTIDSGVVQGLPEALQPTNGIKAGESLVLGQEGGITPQEAGHEEGSLPSPHTDNF